MKTLFLAITFFLAVTSGTASACNAPTSDRGQLFLVSGVMSKKGEEATIKLVHSMLRGASEAEVLQSFVRAAIELHPGYKMQSVLASKPEPAECGKPTGMYFT